MENAVTSVAKSSLSSVITLASKLITEEIKLLQGVRQELFFIKEELEMMQAFLRAASAQKVKGETVIIWVMQVQELAFDVEDCLQEASVHLMKKSCLSAWCFIKKRDSIARKIRVLKARIEDVSKRNLRYDLVKSSINADKNDPIHHQVTSTMLSANDESLIVGLDKPMRDLIQLIQEKSAERRVILVVGMGGHGKTTLVRKVYNCQNIRNHFIKFAWVNIYHPFNIEEFIESLAEQILDNTEEVGKKEQEGKKESLSRKPRKQMMEDMKQKLIKILENKKYVIVLDDLSNKFEWEKIELELPKGNGSRIIITTRSEKLAESISHSSSYKIKPLSRDDAKELFFKAVYKSTNYHLVLDNQETKEDQSHESKSNMNYHPNFSAITKNDSEDNGEKLPHESNVDMKSSANSPEITEEDRENGEDMKEDPHHKSKSNTKYDPNSSDLIEENSELQNQCTTTNHITMEMETQASFIVEKCGRLPLAIVTIGSCLATKPKTSAEWKAMHDHLSSELGNNPNLEVVVKTVLSSSYDIMPYHL